MEVRVVSDHCLVILELKTPFWGPTPFHFENMWLHQKSFNSEFANWWKDIAPTGWESHKFITKLKLIKEKVKK